MTEKPASAPTAFTVPLLLGLALAFIGGSMDGPTWAKLSLLFAAIALILFSAARRLAAARAAAAATGSAERGRPGPDA